MSQDSQSLTWRLYLLDIHVQEGVRQYIQILYYPLKCKLQHQFLHHSAAEGHSTCCLYRNVYQISCQWSVLHVMVSVLYLCRTSRIREELQPAWNMKDSLTKVTVVETPGCFRDSTPPDWIKDEVSPNVSMCAPALRSFTEKDLQDLVEVLKSFTESECGDTARCCSPAGSVNDLLTTTSPERADTPRSFWKSVKPDTMFSMVFTLEILFNLKNDPPYCKFIMK